MAIITGLISYYKHEEAAGDTIDSHGSNDGTVDGATYEATGIIDDALSFDGDNDFISIPSTIASQFITINMWVYVNDLGIGNAKFYAHRVRATNTRIYIMQTNTDFCIRVGEIAIQDTGATLITGWQMLTLTVDNGTWTAFYNGSEEDTGAYTAFAQYNNVAGIGAYVDGVGAEDSFADAIIDEVGIWSRVLTDTEIEDLYNSGAGLQYPFTAGLQLNIGDNWKVVEGMQINIGDDWKEVQGAQINIGDAWKEIF